MESWVSLKRLNVRRVAFSEGVGSLNPDRKLSCALLKTCANLDGIKVQGPPVSEDC